MRRRERENINYCHFYQAKYWKIRAYCKRNNKENAFVRMQIIFTLESKININNLCNAIFYKEKRNAIFY